MTDYVLVDHIVHQSTLLHHLVPVSSCRGNRIGHAALIIAV